MRYRLFDNYRTVWPLVRQYRRALAAGLVFLVLTNVFTLMPPWILKAAVDDLQSHLAVRTLLVYCGLILAAALLQGVCRFAMRRILIGLSRDVEYHLRNRVFAHVLSLPLAFFQRMRTGDIMSRCTSDIEAARMAVGPGIMHLVNTSVTLVIALASMLALHPGLTAVAFIPTPGVALLMYYSARFYHRRYLAVQVQSARLNTVVQESFSGIRVVKSYVQEAFQEARFREANREYMRLNLRLARALGFFHPLVGMVAGLGTLLVLWYGGRLIIAGEITLGTLVAFMGFLALLIWPTIALGWVVTLVQRGSAALGRINEILNTGAETDPPGARALPPAPGGSALEARGLSFSYPGRDEPVLRDVSFSIAPGERIALVGRTGAGKSTLLHLAARLRDVPEGTLFLDGVDVEGARLDDLRGRIGFVPQETFLFTASLRENIAVGAPAGAALPDGAVEEAARVAGIAGEIEAFPRGWDSLVGERGLTLSGGQKQRVAIARALLRDPRLLILDDALSAVDARTEEEILDRLLAGGGRTVILVSHRLTTIRRSSRVLFLDGGRVTESGSHEELTAAGGGYHRMMEKQQLAEALEREAP